MSDIELLHSSFYIQKVEIKGRVLLAPMDGYTDSPFRVLCQKFGSSLNTSEFINGIEVVNGHPHLKFHTYFSSGERPFAYQVFDDNPERLLKSAQILQTAHPDIIDINMGCSARNVSNRGAGAGLLKDIEKIGRMTTLLVANLQTPVTAKIRLGWDDNTKNYLEVTRVLLESGVSAITVHARTRKQEYSGTSDWNAIAEIKKVATVPIIGNGDVSSLQDATHLIQLTGCDAVMIGRAAIGNPWVFSGRNKDEITKEELYNVISTHLFSMTDLYSPRLGTMLFRKHLVKYMQPYLTTVDIRQNIFSIVDPAILLDNIQELLNN